jgi:hypothetical protein
MTSEAPTNPPQRARLCAQITGAGRDAAEVNSRRRAIKQREKSGLVVSLVQCVIARESAYVFGYRWCVHSS